jgi:hypothetical protein
MDRGNTALQQMDEGTGRIFEEEKRKMMPYFLPPNIQKKYAQKSRVTHVAAHIWLKCLKKQKQHCPVMGSSPTISRLLNNDIIC